MRLKQLQPDTQVRVVSQADALGVDVCAGFAAADTVLDDAGTVVGVRISDMADGSH